jgi:PAS domain S-box-containing protein
MKSGTAPDKEAGDDDSRSSLKERRSEKPILAREDDKDSRDTGVAGIAIFDDHLRYVEVNETLANLHGIPAEEHVGKSLAEIIPAMAHVVEPVIEKTLRTGEPQLNIELEGESATAPGVIRNWTVSLVPLKGDDGKTRGVGALILDITNRRTQTESQPRISELDWDGSDEKQFSGTSSSGQLSNRIKILKEVSVALSAAAEVLEKTRSAETPTTFDVENGIDFNDEVRRFEVNLIERALRESGGNQKKAAQLLNLKHTTLHTKIKRYDIPLAT